MKMRIGLLTVRAPHRAPHVRGEAEDVRVGSAAAARAIARQRELLAAHARGDVWRCQMDRNELKVPKENVSFDD